MTAPAAPTTAQATKTAYHVLKKTSAPGGTPTFQLVGLDITAVNAEAAVRVHAEKAGDQKGVNGGSLAEGTYVAVPARSWKPVTVKSETKTVLTFSNGKTS